MQRRQEREKKKRERTAVLKKLGNIQRGQALDVDSEGLAGEFGSVEYEIGPPELDHSDLTPEQLPSNFALPQKLVRYLQERTSVLPAVLNAADRGDFAQIAAIVWQAYLDRGEAEQAPPFYWIRIQSWALHPVGRPERAYGPYGTARDAYVVASFMIAQEGFRGLALVLEARMTSGAVVESRPVWMRAVPDFMLPTSWGEE